MALIRELRKTLGPDNYSARYTYNQYSATFIYERAAYNEESNVDFIFKIPEDRNKIYNFSSTDLLKTGAFWEENETGSITVRIMRVDIYKLFLEGHVILAPD